jgi:hypothetical protein
MILCLPLDGGGSRRYHHDDEEHLMMLSCLMVLYTRDGAKPQQGGSALGHRKSKPRQRLEGYCTSPTTDCMTIEVVF